MLGEMKTGGSGAKRERRWEKDETQLKKGRERNEKQSKVTRGRQNKICQQSGITGKT